MTIDEEIQIQQKAQEYFEKGLSYNQVHKQGVIDGYNKAIDKFVKEAIDKLVEFDKENDFVSFGVCIDIIYEVAKQIQGWFDGGKYGNYSNWIMGKNFEKL